MSWKSFFHRLGETAKNATMASPLGFLWDVASQTVSPSDGQGHFEAYTNAVKGHGAFGFGGAAQIDAILNTATAKTPDKPEEGFGLGDALHFGYDYGINRPISTVNGVLNAAQFDHKNPLSASLWRKEFNLSDHVSGGQQAVAGGSLFRSKFGNASPNSPEAQDWFKHDPVGKIASGSMDIMANLADPTFFAGKAIKAQRLANTVFKDAAARDLSFDLARGNITAEQAAEQYGARIAKRAVKNQTAMDKFLTSTRGMDKTQLSQLPQFRDTGDAGAIAYWIERADKAAADDADALIAKRDIFGVIQGNQASIDRLTARQAELADEMQRMSRPVDITEANARFTWDDNGQGMYDFLNRPSLDDLAKLDQVGQEMARLDRLYAIRASTSKFGANSLDRAQTSARMRDLQESVIYSGMAGRPIRVVRGTVGKAAPGFINTKIADEGLDGMRRGLRDSNMDAGTRFKLLNDFASAPTREARALVVQRAEEEIFKAEGARFGKTPAEVKRLLSMARGRRAGAYAALRNRLFSAAPEAKYIMHTDEGGYLHAFDRPFLQSQLEDMAPLTDPKVLQKVLKQEARTGWLGAMTRGGQEATDVMDQVAQVATRVWKDAQLFRLAYPMRIQVDTQMRLMASLGALQYLASAGHGFVNLLSNHNFIANDIERLTGAPARAKASILTRPETFGTYVDQETIDRLTPQVEQLNARIAARNTPRHKQELTDKLVAKRDALQAQLDRAHAAPVQVQPARNGDELGMLTRTLAGHTTRDLMMADVNDSILRHLRATGDFDIVKGGDPNWTTSMLRAVNQQIRNSPTAMKVLTEGDDHAVANWLRDDAAGRKEWQNFSSEYGYDPIPWIRQIRAHVNHTIPDPALRARVLERSINLDDMDEFYNDVTLRPAVHGEVFVPFLKSPVAAHWDKARNWWYKFASDTPETIMGRHPLYNARFRHHMRETISRMGGREVSADDVNAARRIADRKARMDVANTLFDLSDMSNLTHMARFLAPFFAPWEDTMTKWGRLLYEDPSRAIRLEQVWTAPDKADMTLVDDQGVQYVILPGMFSPFGSKGWRIRKDSGNIVFQGEPWWLPGFGPLVQVPVNELVLKLFPNKSDSKVVKYLLPTGVNHTQGGVKRVGSELEPSWVRKAQAAFSHGSAEYTQTYAMLWDQELVKYNLGQRKTKPTKAEIANATRNWHLMRALTAFASPVTADPSPEFQYYIDKAHEYRDNNNVIQAAYTAWAHSGPDGKPPPGPPPPRDWQEAFYRDHPQYFEMSTSLSLNNTGIVASDKAFQAIKKYRKLIAEHPDLGWFIVGPDNNGDFNRGVYAYETTQSVGGGSTMTFRGSKDPAQASQDAEIAKGWMDYRKGITMIQVELEARGLHSLQQRGAEDLLAAKRKFVSDMSNYNPQWAVAYGTHDDNQAEEFLRSAKDIMHGGLAKRPDMVTLQQYLQGRRMMRDEMKRRGINGLPDADSENSTNRDLRIAWDQFTAQLVANNVGFEQMWQRALDADTLRNDI